MNVILLHPEDLCASSDQPNSARLSDRAYHHVQNVLRAKPGDEIRVGILNGRMGKAIITQDNEISFAADEDPPLPLDLQVYLALPRPKALPRILQTLTTLGIKQITLMHAYRVEKAYWSCEQITPEAIAKACRLGLEQARDTVMPTITLERRFKPFVEDRLPAQIRDTKAFMGHPHAENVCPFNVQGKVSLVIGPEGGFIPYELDQLTQVGFNAVKSYERILKTETAIASMIGRLK